MKKKPSFGWIAAGLAAAIIIGIVVWDKNQPGEYDAFAECLEEKGAVFYGAFWCPNCQNQKKLFGQSERLLPYVECSTPDGRGQTVECQEKGIERYPTWIFADGGKEIGVLPLATLAEKTGCQL
jgi:hypothetical protein